MLFLMKFALLCLALMLAYPLFTWVLGSAGVWLFAVLALVLLARMLASA